MYPGKCEKFRQFYLIRSRDFSRARIRCPTLGEAPKNENERLCCDPADDVFAKATMRTCGFVGKYVGYNKEQLRVF
jgi:hypothetical protein